MKNKILLITASLALSAFIAAPAQSSGFKLPIDTQYQTTQDVGGFKKKFKHHGGFGFKKGHHGFAKKKFYHKGHHSKFGHKGFGHKGYVKKMAYHDPYYDGHGFHGKKVIKKYDPYTGHEKVIVIK